MSGGAIIDLVSKGAQDVHLHTQDLNASFFRSVYTKHVKFAQVAKKLDAPVPAPNKFEILTVKRYGDLVNGVWFEGPNAVELLRGTTFDLYIGGRKIDTHTHEFITEIWHTYMSDTVAKTRNLHVSNNGFLPLHFFFCDDPGASLPLVAMQYTDVELHVTWGPNVPPTGIDWYANYVFLDTAEREAIVAREETTMLVTQVQRYAYPLATGQTVDVDLSYLNHPVKSLYFGFGVTDAGEPVIDDRFTFAGCDLRLNGTSYFESLSAMYFHTAQCYYRSRLGRIDFDHAAGAPVATRFFTYNFGLDATDASPTGACNFSRLDNAKLTLHDVVVSPNRVGQDLILYAVNYNVIRIKKGLAGIIFAD